MNPESPYNQGGQPQFQPQPSMQPPQQPQQQPMQPPQYQPQQPQPQPGYTPLPPVQTPPLKRRKPKLWIVLTFVFLALAITSAGISIWAYINYLDQKNNVDSKVTAAVATAVKEQQDKDAADFIEKEKQPNRQFAGPDDFGRLSFDYPKTWSVYVAKDAAEGGNYEAYFNPVSVPAISSTERFALRVTIETKDYDAVLKSYDSLVKKGELKSASVTADDQNGTRLDGNFTKDIKGSAVLFKIRDKTVTIRTDAEAFANDYNELIKTITFNK